MNELCTNKELSKWLSTEGEILQDGWVAQAFSYEEGTENDTVSSDIQIRKWSDTSWSSPTRSYMGLD